LQIPKTATHWGIQAIRSISFGLYLTTKIDIQTAVTRTSKGKIKGFAGLSELASTNQLGQLVAEQANFQEAFVFSLPLLVPPNTHH
jgi:hypothetical protein